jgi:hypothetical protein
MEGGLFFISTRGEESKEFFLNAELNETLTELREPDCNRRLGDGI